MLPIIRSQHDADTFLNDHLRRANIQVLAATFIDPVKTIFRGIRAQSLVRFKHPTQGLGEVTMTLTRIGENAFHMHEDAHFGEGNVRTFYDRMNTAQTAAILEVYNPLLFLTEKLLTLGGMHRVGDTWTILGAVSQAKPFDMQEIGEDGIRRNVETDTTSRRQTTLHERYDVPLFAEAFAQLAEQEQKPVGERRPVNVGFRYKGERHTYQQPGEFRSGTLMLYPAKPNTPNIIEGQFFDSYRTVSTVGLFTRGASQADCERVLAQMLLPNIPE